MDVVKASNYAMQKAEYYIHHANYGRAFAHYILYFELNTESRIPFEDVFVSVTSLWCNILEQRDQIQNVRYCFTEALRYFPDNAELLNHYAAHYARCNEARMALKYFEIAHAVHPDYLPAEKNLQSMYASKVPQWHFRMLNDKRRNAFYKLAIESTLKQIDNRSDSSQFQIIDIGTGSGLLSLFAAAYKQQVYNEMKVIAIEGCEIMAQIARRIFSCNNANVELIERLSTDISNQNIYNLLITEIFDCCLFGEGVLSTLMHAHKELLTENAIVLPYSAKLLIFGIESAELDNKYRFRPDSMETETNLRFPKCIRKVHEEPYDAFSINSYEYKQITNVQEVVTVCFNDLEQLEKIFHEENAIGDVFLQVLEEGTCHAFVICFELMLDQKGDYKITTNPLERDNGNFCFCWEQGIVFLKHPEVLKTGEMIKLNVSATNDKLNIDYQVANGNLPCEIFECFQVCSEAISQLNFEALTSIYVKLVDNLTEQWPKTILDLSSLPLFSILLYKRAKLLNRQVKITCTVRREHFKLVSKLFELNDIDEQTVTILIDKAVLNTFYTETYFDLIVYEPMLENGLMNETFYGNADDFKNMLNENGQILPNEVKLCFEVVESKYLDECTKALDENLFGFSIAKKMNEFSVNEMRTLNGNFEHKKLSSIVRTPLYAKEEALQTTISVKTTDKGRANGIIYWFEANYQGDVVSTLNTSYNQAAFVLTDNDKVETTSGACIEVKVKQDHGLLKIFT